MKFKKLEKKIEQKNKPLLMLVDDEEPNLRQIGSLLEDDYNLVTAGSGVEALEKCQDPQLSVIISDQRMPQMTGTELFEELEKRKHPAVRIILTGYADMNNVIEAVNKSNVYRYLSKPVNHEELMSAIDSGYRLFESNRYTMQLMAKVKGLIEENAQLRKQAGESSISEYQDLMNSKQVNLAILNLDLRGFSKYMANSSPAVVIDTLQHIYVPIYEQIYQSAGIVDKHMGDGLMAIFGLHNSEGIGKAGGCLQSIVAQFAANLEQVQDQSAKTLKLAGGLAHGNVVMGLLGDKNRSELAVIGEAANLAARLQEFTKVLFKKADWSKSKALGVVDSRLIDNTGFDEVAVSEEEAVRDYAMLQKVYVTQSRK